MAKSKVSRNELGRMILPYADHFPGRILSICNLSTGVKVIERKLTKRQLYLLKKGIFGHFLECRSFPFCGVILHNILLRQVDHGEYRLEDQLWFQIGEHLICLSIGEWCLITGLSYGVDTTLINNKSGYELLKMCFGGDLFRNINLKQFDALFEKLNFEAMDDINTLKITLFYFVDRVLNGRNSHCQINFDWLNEVDDINYFQNRPWGHLSWETIYDNLDNALYEKDEKFKMAQLENSNHKIEKYNLYDFKSEAWIYEAIGGLPPSWVVKRRKRFPASCNGSSWLLLK
ncbi:hypothetical protein CUMW_192300 [Citrus unshiu]|uniref:DUF1985 domain-containing protein n=1 Tax=Citrus unshiu TaxID=55188 RepID=A0A2H5Q3M3_CITUN|nr:hypothetical protein CUMW_192300 [Citrus unshiu]